MARTLTDRLLLCLLLGLVTVVTAGAQDAAATVERAQRTLAEMARLLDAVLARREVALAANRGGTVAPAEEGWQSLFDGATLAGWARTGFTGGGPVRVEPRFRGGPPAIVVEAGSTLSGFHRAGEVPKTDYEVTLEAMKIEGGDFMCGLTFPVGDSHASLILGGWGGTVVGISSIDNQDASENETTRFRQFPPDRWFRVRLRVTPEKIEAWLDDDQIVNQVITDRRIGLRFGEIAKSVPLGLSTYQTSSAFRAIRLRRLDTR